MNVQPTHLDDGYVVAGSPTSQATASVSPSSHKLLILSVRNRNATPGAPTTPTATGCNVTWVQIATRQSSAGGDNFHRVTLFRAMGSPTTGAVTIDFNSNAQNSIEWSLDEFSNVDITGDNGENAVVQVASNDVASTSLSVTLSALSSAKNLAFGFAYLNAITTIVKGTDYTELFNQTFDGAGTFNAQYATNETVVDWSGGVSGLFIGMAIEIKFVQPSGGFIYNLI